MSVPLSPLDCVSTMKIKNQYDVSTRELLIETLIREAKKTKNNNVETEIPPDFLTLVDSNIVNSSGTSSKSDKQIWVAFGKWLGFKGNIKKKKVRQHIRLKWQKIQHDLDLRNNDTHIKNTSTKHIAKEKKNQIKKNQIKVNARNLQPSKGLIGFRYIVNPECVVDKNNRTLIHLELLDSLDAVTKATEAVNFYYYHTLEHT